MTRHALASALIFLAALAWAAPASAAGTVCYGDLLDGACTVPDLRVQPAAQIALPGDLWADGDETRMTLTVILDNATFAAPPTMIGEAAVACSSESAFCAAADGPFALTDLRVAGTFGPGDTITARVLLTNPNAATTLFDRDIVLARFPGVTEIELFALNPAGNDTQQTFVRLANVDTVPALVRLRATDDAGQAGGEVSIEIPPGAAVQLSSADLEAGNPDKGLVGSLGQGAGKWRVQIVADAQVRAQLFVRNRTTGTLSALSDVEQ